MAGRARGAWNTPSRASLQSTKSMASGTAAKARNANRVSSAKSGRRFMSAHANAASLLGKGDGQNGLCGVEEEGAPNVGSKLRGRRADAACFVVRGDVVDALEREVGRNAAVPRNEHHRRCQHARGKRTR